MFQTLDLPPDDSLKLEVGDRKISDIDVEAAMNYQDSLLERINDVLMQNDDSRGNGRSDFDEYNIDNPVETAPLNFGDEV